MRLRRLERWESNILKILGMVELALAAMLAAPAAVAAIYGEDALPYLLPLPPLIACGSAQCLFFRRVDNVVPASGVLVIVCGWLVAFAVSLVPFAMSGFSAVDSVFEAVSGFTTTGASVAPDIDALPRSLLFWRSLIQWAGGLAVVLLFVFIVPTMGLGGRAFLNNELSGSGDYNFSMRMNNAAKHFIAIYLLLSAAEAALLYACGLGVFDSATATFSTISTGGMSVRSEGAAGYPFPAQAVLLAFMFLGGTNFYLHYRALYKRDAMVYVKSREFAWTVAIFAVASAAVLGVLAGSEGLGGAGGDAWGVVFMVVSLGTSTGFSVADHAAWPAAASAMLLAVTMIGTMSGSTSGGVKVYRVLIVKSFIGNGIYRMIHPRTIREIKMDGYLVDRESALSAVIVLLLFAFTGAAVTLAMLVLEPGMTLMDSVSATGAALSTSGLGVSDVDFASLSPASKMLLSFVMWAGRVELVMALCLFTRSFWNDAALGMKKAGGGRR
jgi:trk system potassium uptake protein TrkH